jgi:hypothetical protein
MTVWQEMIILVACNKGWLLNEKNRQEFQSP